MDICMLNPFYHPYQGGTEKHLYEVCRRLSKKHDVTVITSKLPGTKSFEFSEGVNVVRVDTLVLYKLPHFLPPPIPLSPFFLSRLLDEVNDHEIFHMHNRFFYNLVDVAIIKKLGGKTLGLTLHNARTQGIAPSTDFIGKFYDDFLGKEIMRRCDALAAVSRNTLELTAPKEFHGRARILYNGVDVDKYKPSNKEGDIRKKYGLPEGRFIFSVARLQPQKGYDYLLEAFAEISKKHKDVSLVILGRGPMEGELKKKCFELKIYDKVFFITQKLDEDDVSKLYAACELFALPSKWEPFGMVFAEAMSSGKPTIGTRIGGIPEIITPGTGLLCEPCSSKDLAEKIDFVLSNPKAGRRFGLEGRKRVAKVFTWENAVKGYEAMYKGI